jgi:hypothetical protein
MAFQQGRWLKLGRVGWRRAHSGHSSSVAQRNVFDASPPRLEDNSTNSSENGSGVVAHRSFAFPARRCTFDFVFVLGQSR